MNDSAGRQTSGWTIRLDKVWRILASPHLTVILLVWMAVVLALSSVIPQVPPHIEDPIVRSRWLAGIPILTPPLVERLQPLGVFDLLGSVWLRLPLALLLAHAMVVLAAWGPAVWHCVRASLPSPAGEGDWRDEVNAPGKSFRLDLSWSEPAAQVSHRIIGRLEKAGYCVLPGAEYPPGEGQPSFVAWRRRWVWLALAGIYLGLALVSLGLILGGWLSQADEVNMEPDNPAKLPVVNASSLVLDKVTTAGNDPLKPAAGVVSMRVLTGVGESQQLNLQLHRSRLFRGMWLTLTDLRPVAVVTATDIETGESILLQPFSAHTPSRERVRLPLAGNSEARFAGVPSKNVTLRVDYQAATPVFSLFFFRGAAAQPSQGVSLDSGGEATFEKVRYRLTLDYDALLRANSTLWWLVVAVGWGVVVLSLILLAVAPPIHLRGQVTAERKGSQVTLAVDMVGDEQRFHHELRALVISDD